MLKWLDLDDCKKLVSLTELPPSLLYLTAVNCTYVDTDSTQRSILENMLQTFSKDPPDGHVEAFSLLPGAQVPCMFDFQKMEASITILPIPKSDLCGFIFCIILSEGFKSKAQDTNESYCHLKNDIDELQPRSIEGEMRSSNIDEVEPGQPSYSHEEEEHFSVSRPPIKHVYVKRRRTK
ncbi:hypothetical protein TSUD_129230 [Trifolium subterraneum]|uniref:Uncharacterized protein n=1 Tax=Trifolium subterraneum TaxID=3900 RepID=A0A2Z6PGB4_TRISU|nr:hypothetical protein TSUD_129230 [Trifolium subterraneum]